MGIRDTIRRIRQEWRDTPLPPPRRPAKRTVTDSDECTSDGCTRAPVSDGYCQSCWTAIFG